MRTQKIRLRIVKCYLTLLEIEDGLTNTDDNNVKYTETEAKKNGRKIAGKINI